MISVVLATYNGARTLGTTLDAISQLESPSDGFEVIVVDNASTDTTREIAESYESRLPVTVVHEAKPGRPNALNTGIAMAGGELVLFTDDDVIPVRDWLLAYERAAHDYLDVDIFAGQIRHYWQKSPPEWLVRLAEEGMSYGGTPINRRDGPIEATAIKGANFMVRKSLLTRHQFATGIGADGSANYAAGDETEFLVRLQDEGHKTRFISAACIQHIVRPHEVAIWPVIRRYFRIGRGIEAVGVQQFGTDFPTLFGYPRFLFRTMPFRVLRAFGLFLSAGSYAGVKESIDIAIDCGRAYEWRAIRARGQIDPASGPGRQTDPV